MCRPTRACASRSPAPRRARRAQNDSRRCRVQAAGPAVVCRLRIHQLALGQPESKIAAVPSQPPAILPPLPAGTTLAAIIKRELATPQQLRSALVLREILGPPLGLQS